MLITLAAACTHTTPNPTTDDPTAVEHSATPTGDTGRDTGDTTTPGDPCVWEGESPLGPTASCPIWRMTGNTVLDGLDIEPGTILEADAGTIVYVEGRLRANGTPEAPIVLRASGTDRWGGLLVRSGDPKGVGYVPAVSELRHVEVVHAGADGRAAVSVAGGKFSDCDPYGSYLCGPEDEDQLVIEDLTIRDAGALGLYSTAWTTFETPVRFEGVAGALAFLTSVGLASRVVEDLGGNAHPAIGVAWKPGVQRWAEQGVPLELEDGFDLHLHQTAYEWTRDELTIDANTVLVGEGERLGVAGGRLEATDVRFGPLTPGTRWSGLANLGDETGYVAAGGGHVETVRSEIRLTGARVEGTTSPAIDGGSGTLPPLLSGTTVTDVGAAPGQDVCVASCAPLGDPRLGNTLDCSIPVSCTP
ncbi:MAG: hypothetical protein H6734_27890 [Alphaproteobacteria bacterium]|nr:hypothetical protein [Alphaproteobacteria bacterium]